MAFRIYTKTGDDGTTGLFGGTRVHKDDLRIEAYGTVDELNAVLGIALTCDMPDNVRQELADISSTLFTLGADLATPLDPPPTYAIPRMTADHVSKLERSIDAHDEVLEPLKAFILPGGTPAASYLHLARTVCRRAERCTVALARRDDIGDHVVHYLNRLSDYLFTAARAVNHVAGVQDVPWRSGT
ncbi:MAG: cob(I)yrinic acid a,c-diamide adenosyltransferase [Candidatus Kapabacteria bacterium]|nr:cob(I)yrinic acid a,c-diamide adenosyltransferase [Candidatus Kapabacteria bacterium]